MLKTQQELEERPVCFGEKYSSSAAECVGGHDPAYQDPESGERIRPRCTVASQCAVRMQVNRQSNQLTTSRPPGFVPASNLTRPLTQFNSPVAPRPNWNPPVPQQQTHGGLLQQPQHWQGSTTQMQPVNYYMPQYLTVREPITPGQSMAKRLLIESIRSIGKSLGHTVAHFFDVEMFNNRGNGSGQ